jgi:hypothetical protein
MASGIPSVFPTQLVELLVKRLPAFADLSTRHRYNIARMLWDYANNRYQHSRYAGAAFSVGYIDDLWGNRRTRNQEVRNFFSCSQGDNHSHLMSNYSPDKFLGEVLLEYLEDDTPIDFMDGDSRLDREINRITMQRLRVFAQILGVPFRSDAGEKRL